MTQKFEIKAPDFVVRSKQLFEQQGMMHTLGARVTRIEPGEVEITAPITSEVSQQHGYAHAGLAWSLGDSAAGFAAQTLLSETQGVMTTEMKINLLNPGRGASLRAVGRVVKPGKRLIVAKADVYADTGSHIATLLGTMMIMEPEA